MSSVSGKLTNEKSFRLHDSLSRWKKKKIWLREVNTATAIKRCAIIIPCKTNTKTTPKYFGTSSTLLFHQLLPSSCLVFSSIFYRCQITTHPNTTLRPKQYDSIMYACQKEVYLWMDKTAVMCSGWMPNKKVSKIWLLTKCI